MAEQIGQFLPTSYVFDVESLRSDKIDQDQLRELLIRIALAFQKSNIVVNNKTSATYDVQETLNNNQFFPLATSTLLRPEYRKLVDFGALPNAGTKSVAHGITITDNTIFTRIYATASDQGVSKEYIPIPFVDVSGTVVAGDVEIYVDATNVNITTTGDGTNFTIDYVVLEYLQ